MTSPSASAVVIDDVSRVFTVPGGDVVALDRVSLTVRAGSFTSLIGPSGCGKSTLLRLVADLDRATSGTVTVFGTTPEQARLARSYGIAFQQAGLLPWRTVRANIELPLQVAGVSAASRRLRANELLELVGLADFADRYPDELSGGMQQRVAIARALAEEPSLLLMDEPFGALDEMTREHLQTQLLRIVAASRATVIFVTHSIPEAVFLSDQVVVMSPRPGRITQVVPIELDRTAVVGSAVGHDPVPEAATDADTDVDLRAEAPFAEAVARVRHALHGGAGRAPVGHGGTAEQR